MTVQTTRVSLPCLRCDGDGEIPRYYHYAHGRCFRCEGSGLDPRAGRTVTIHNGDVDAQDAIDRDIENYKAQIIADKVERDEAFLDELEERFINRHVCGDTDRHYWG